MISLAASGPLNQPFGAKNYFTNFPRTLSEKMIVACQSCRVSSILSAEGLELLLRCRRTPKGKKRLGF
jgi:hypothetical protein